MDLNNLLHLTNQAVNIDFGTIISAIVTIAVTQLAKKAQSIPLNPKNTKKVRYVAAGLALVSTILYKLLDGSLATDQEFLGTLTTGVIALGNSALAYVLAWAGYEGALKIRKPKK